MTPQQIRVAVRRMNEDQRSLLLSKMDARQGLAMLLGQQVKPELVRFTTELLRGGHPKAPYGVRAPSGRSGRCRLVKAAE